MCKEIGPITTQNESQEQLGIHVRRWDLFRAQAGHRSVQGLLQLHGIISTQGRCEGRSKGRFT
jgi:hypothetical protein